MQTLAATPLTNVVAQLRRQAVHDASQDINAMSVQQAQLAVTTTSASTQLIHAP